MNKLPKDVIELITNKLTPRDFFNYCESDAGQEFCAKKEVWIRRIQKDFGFLLEGKNKHLLLVNYETDPKQAYFSLFTKTSNAAETIKVNILEVLGRPFVKLMKDNYPLLLNEFFFNYLLKMINQLDTSNIQDMERQTNIYFWKYSNWQIVLPVKLFNAQISFMWDREIGGVISDYVVEIFS